MTDTSNNLEILKQYKQALLKGLNDRQLEAVEALTGSTLVIAGAGSGKTAVLTRRVAYLISKGQTPGEILCLTFTNKAAREMNERVRDLLQSIKIQLPYVPPWKEDYLTNPLLATFHSLGVRILREFGEKINLRPEFSILDLDDQKKIIRRIFKELNVDKKKIQPNLVSYFISQCKQELLESKDSRRVSKDFLPIFHQIYQKYEAILQESSIVDFDDLLLKPYLLLKANPGVLEILRNRWPHIMIDEFQDTNEAQIELIKLLQPYDLLRKDPQRSLFVVGDDAQSIYGFRGSKIEIILNFEEQYPGTEEIILNQNYRSTQKILDLAEQVLTHNPKQKKKALFTENETAVDVHYYTARNDKDEAEFVIRTMAQLYCMPEEAEESSGSEDDIHLDSSDAQAAPTPQRSVSNDPVSSMFDLYLDDESFSPSASLQNYQPTSWSIPANIDWGKVKELDSTAVLYRTHSQSRAIEEAFLQNRVPYKLVSGTRFLDRKEIKDVMSMLKFLANGNDKVALRRFLPLVLTGVGPKTLDKIMAYLDDYEYPLPPKHQEQLLHLINKLQTVWTEHTRLIDLTKDLLVASGYARYLKGEYPNKDEYEARMENIGEIFSLMFPFDQDDQIPLAERLNQFLAQVALMTSQELNEGDDKTPKISIMSLHQSKGLEFETVFLVGIEDGLLPHINSLIEPGGVEEEVRLAYVGVTRAKKHLYLTSADSRITFGQIKANPISRIFRPFLDTYVKRTK